MTTEPRKSIFITGAASGIGRATAKLFANRGWYVGATDRDSGGLDSLRSEAGANSIWTQTVDVTSKPDLEAALTAFFAASGNRLDLMFNNAGIGESGWFEDVPYDAAMRVVQINFVGVLNGAYASLPFLKQTPNSLMFSTSSSSATYGMPRIAVYAATKFAVKGLTEALSAEWQRHGVRVADMLPGLIDTAILRNTPDHTGERPKPTEDEFYANAPKTGPFRLTPPEAVAETVWSAYHGDKIHWYVPKEIGRIDLMKAFAPKMVRNRIVKQALARMGAPKK